MCSERRNQRMSDRGVSSPVGVILILGITIASVTALFTVGGIVLGDTRADAERTQMENAMSGFSSKASLVGLGESGEQRFALGRASEGQVDIRENAGNVSMYVDDIDGDRTYVGNVSMGTVVYRSGDSEIAYQGGGVWAKQNGYTQMVSPPEFDYRSETLTFPILNVTGSGSATGDVRGTVRAEGDGRQLYPSDSNKDFKNPLTSGTVYIEIETDYCHGWESFFRERSQGSLEQTCDDGAENTVIIDLSVSVDPVFGSAVTAGSTYDPGNADVSSYREGAYLPSASPEIMNQVSDCDGGVNCDSFSASDTLTEGTYYTEEMTDFQDLTLNTSEGDVDIVLNDVDRQGVSDTGDITITGDGNVTVYFNSVEEFEMVGGGSNGNRINAGGNATQFNMYVHSDADIVFNGGIEYSGGLYAPRSQLSGSSGSCQGGGGGAIEVTGAIIVDTFCFQAGSASFEFDEGMENLDSGIATNNIKYLHVSESTIRVEVE